MKNVSSKKNDVKDTMQIHSRAKVEFYGSYLARYLKILNCVDYINRINIYDVFCGMGIYKDGHKGSPIKAFDIVKEIYEETLKKKVHLYVNDGNPDRIKNVKEYIDKYNLPTACCDVHYFNEDANDMLNEIRNLVSKSSSYVRNLVFIDPYGYKEIKKEMIDSLMSNGKTEVILFLPISHMYRFTQFAVENSERVQFKPLCEFVKSFFDEKHPITNDANITVMDYIAYVREALSFNNKYYTTSYHIERNKNSYFALFFLSSNLLGYEKILEAKWQLDSEDGNGFNLPRQLGLFDDQEREAKKVALYEKLKHIIVNYLQTPRTNNEIYIFILKNEFLPKHASQVLKNLQQEDKISVNSYFGDCKVRKGSFYLNYKDYKINPHVIINLKK